MSNKVTQFIEEFIYDDIDRDTDFKSRKVWEETAKFILLENLKEEFGITSLKELDEEQTKLMMEEIDAEWQCFIDDLNGVY